MYDACMQPAFRRFRHHLFLYRTHDGLMYKPTPGRRWMCWVSAKLSFTALQTNSPGAKCLPIRWTFTRRWLLKTRYYMAVMFLMTMPLRDVTIGHISPSMPKTAEVSANDMSTQKFFECNSIAPSADQLSAEGAFSVRTFRCSIM